MAISQEISPIACFAHCLFRPLLISPIAYFVNTGILLGVVQELGQPVAFGFGSVFVFPPISETPNVIPKPSPINAKEMAI
jgi:hypothetical protein